MHGDGTRLANVEDISHSNMEEIAALQRGHVETHSKINETHAHMGAVEDRMATVEGSLKSIESMLKDALKMKSQAAGSASGSSSHGENPHASSHSHFDSSNHWHRSMKADLPLFDGEGVDEWVFKVHEYFNWYEVPIDMRLRMISFHLTGPAYTWYRWGVNNNIDYTWESFLDALSVRFGQNIYYDPKAAIKDLKQVNSVAEYHSQFEELSNQVT